MEKYLSFAEKFISFLGRASSQYHVVSLIVQTLEENGFVLLKEEDSWQLKKDGAYYTVRNDTSICAFRLNKTEYKTKGINIVGTHTDSPGLKIKPTPEILSKQCISIGVEIYGSPILSTWFDRDLAFAGKLIYLDQKGRLIGELVDTKKAVAVIPNLAIHLARDSNKGHEINKQKELSPIFIQKKVAREKKEFSFSDLLKRELKAPKDCKEIIDHDLYFYDHQKPTLLGYNNEFLTGSKIDNLLSCFTALQALINSKTEGTCVLVCNDHEEIGSHSNEGAAGPFLKDILYRICGTKENYSRALSKSMLVSADNAHGVHPNYPEKHDDKHGPILNKGLVIKVNSNQRYATNIHSSAAFQILCKKNNVKYQKFISRNDQPCGSTIGPITATRVGINTIDVGAPTLAMHSIRETSGTKDVLNIYRALKAFYEQKSD